MRFTRISHAVAAFGAAVALVAMQQVPGAASAAVRAPARHGSAVVTSHQAPTMASRSLPSAPGARRIPLAQAGGNEPEGFPPCDAAHDGDVYVDGEDGQIWYCKWVAGAGWIWVPRVAQDEFSIAALYGGFPFVAQSADGVADGDGGFTTVANVQASDGNGNPLEQPPGWIAQLVKLQFWNGSNWVFCADPGQYTFNQSWSSSLGVGWRFPGAAPCGPGWYAAEADAWVWDGSAWQGGGQIADPSGICVDCGWAGSRAIHSHPSRPAKVKGMAKPPFAHPPAAPSLLHPPAKA